MKLDKKKVMLQMARKELSPVDLANRYGASKSRIYKMFQTTVRPSTAGKLAKVLGCDVADIIQED